MIWICKILLLVAACWVQSSAAANILALSITPSYSHQMPVLALTKALAARGHNLTVVTPNPSKVATANYTEIDVSFAYELFRRGDLGFSITKKVGSFKFLKQLLTGLPKMARAQLTSSPVKHFLSWVRDVKYDVVLYEYVFSPAYLGVAHIVGSPPVVGVSTLESSMAATSTMGSPLNLAYASMCLPFTDHMTFYERLTNVAWYYWFTYYRSWYMYPSNDRIVQEVFGKGLPTCEQMERNLSLLMHFTTNSLAYPQAFTPNIVHVGPTHILQPKPLPKDLEDWVSGADEGVVYFSLGSNMQGTALPVQVRDAFLNAFVQLTSYRVLWKWETDTYFPGEAKNVLYRKWIPQQDLLAHPKVKLFITQGGLQSLQEAIHHAVPVIGIPFFADQYGNVRKIAHEEVGIALDLDNINNDTAYWAVNEVLHNPKYRQNMRRLSDISRDTVLSPLDQAVWWVEYVIRHHGARHLRPATLDLHWTQYYLVDVAAFVIAVAGAILVSVFLLVRFVYRKFMTTLMKDGVKLKGS